MSSLNLHQPENELGVNMFRDPNSSPSSLLLSFQNAEQRVFSCSYCRRKFYSPQAFGGHQNAHKLERTLAKKSREPASSSAGHQPEWNHMSPRFEPNDSTHVGEVQAPDVMGLEHLERFGSVETRREMDGQLDLSLRL